MEDFTFIQLLERFPQSSSEEMFSPLLFFLISCQKKKRNNQDRDKHSCHFTGKFSLRHSSLPLSSNLKAISSQRLRSSPRRANIVCVCLYSVRGSVVIRWAGFQLYAQLPLLQIPRVRLPPESKGLNGDRGSFLLRC